MKASELKQGESYGTVWGYEMEFVGIWENDDYNEYTGEPVHSVRYEFRAEDGSTYLTEENVEKFVSNNTVEISTERLSQIMGGARRLDDMVGEALTKVNRLIDRIEDMKLDCDAEVYDALLEIADILGR